MATLIATIALVILFAGIQHMANWIVRRVYKDIYGQRDASSVMIVVVLAAILSVLCVQMIILLNQ
jgi:uncharacterized PurR-regulated membrane protein YhhQ (DUF165 family)